MSVTLRVGTILAFYAAVQACILFAILATSPRSVTEELRLAIDTGSELDRLVRGHPFEARRLASAYLDAGQLKEARALARVVAEVWKDPTLLGEAASGAGLDAEELLRAGAARELLTRANRMARDREDLARAESMAREAMVVFDALEGAAGSTHARHVLATIGNLRGDTGVENAYRSLLERARAAGDHERQAAAINTLANFEERRGRYGDAIEGYRRTLAIAEEHGLSRIQGFAELYIGNLYHRLGVTDRATQWLRRAEHSFARVGDRRLQAMAASNRGASLQVAGDAEGALAAYGEVASLGSGGLGTTRLHLAELLYETARLDEAGRLVRDLLDDTAAEPEATYLRWGALTTSARIHLSSGALGEAEREIDQAGLVLEKLQGRLERVVMRELDSELLRRQGKVDRAVVELEKAISELETLRVSPDYEEERVRFMAARVGVYEALVNSKIEGGASYEELLELTERFRARAFLDGLEGGARLSSVEPELPALRLASAADVAELSAIREALGPTRVLLHYTLLRERLLVIAVDSELGIGGTVVDLPRENLLRWAREFAGEPGSPAGRELARTLLVPVRERLGRFRRLVIVPDRVLFGIPWAALPWNDGLLVETHVTNVAPSASSYERLAWRSPGRSVDPSLLVVADPSSSGRPLPEARGAALALSSLFSQSSLLLGDEASEENVAEAIADYDIVHFGTHARIEPDLPLSSSLTLSGGGGMAERSLLAPIGQDGRLTGYEVLQLSLKPEAVVTLAACETMDGGVNRELAVAGLARAFFERGARAVIATHWPVEDRGTRPLMERFYRALSAGTPEDVALGEAQVALATGQEGERFRDPYYWAGFVMMGYAAP